MRTRRLFAAAMLLISPLAACDKSAGAPAPATTPTPVEARASTTPAAPAITPDQVEPFEDGALYGYRRKAGGAVVLAPRYTMAQGFDAASGLAPVVVDDAWWYIDLSGAKRYKAYVYDNGPDEASEGLTRFVGEDGKVGFLSARGEVAIKPQFDWASPFEGATARYCIGCEPVVEGEVVTEHRGGTRGRVSASGELLPVGEE